MKSIPRPARAALRLRLRMRKTTKTLADTLSPFAPVGWSAAVAEKDGEPRYLHGGEAVIADEKGVGGEAVERDTIFRIASISKVFGAAAALRLVARGLLPLDEDVADVLGFSAGRPITLRQLLTHTAAISDKVYDDVIFTPDAMPLDILLPKSFFPYASGSRFSYSNLGAGVVGMLIEAASGMLFDDFIRQEFFAPLHIDASFHPQRIVRQNLLANCYRVPGREIAYDARAIAKTPLDETPNPRIHYNIPAGKLMISAPDLLRVFRALPETDPALFSYQRNQGSVACDSGRGLGIAYAAEGVFAAGRDFWGHQGCAYGALCEAWIDAASGATAVLLTNGARLNSTGPLYRVGQDGISWLLDPFRQSKV